LSDSQRAELRRRLAEHRTSPDDVLTWSQVQERLPTTR
jgi:putative addiction module component (TIGR02574 family)